MGFTALNIGISVSNLLYCPVISLLRKVYVYKPFEEGLEEGDDGGDGGYQRYDGGSGGVYETVQGDPAKGYGALDLNGDAVAGGADYGYGKNDSFDYKGGFGVPDPRSGK